MDAYNTLKLLGAGPALPVLGSLVVNPSATVTKGASATLVAQAAASSTAVSAFYFYQDTNGNGTYDAGDVCLGCDTTLVNGTADFAVNTSGTTPGTSRYFARAMGTNGQWSTALSTTLTVLAPNDYGNNAATAAAIAVNATLSGSIETGGDQDWFKFQAVAGQKYVISTTLTGLADSVLALYDRNGTTQLAYNDDIASNNPASRIQWTAPASGTYFIKVAAYDVHQTGGYKLSLTSQNSPPVLQSISDQVLSNQAGGIVVPLAATDPDGDHLTFSATAYTIDPKTQAHVSVPASQAALALSGNQLRITKNAGYTGVFYVDVTASDGVNAVLKTFKVTATNTTQQWLTSSSASSMSVGEGIPQVPAFALPAIAAATPIPAANGNPRPLGLFCLSRSRITLFIRECKSIVFRSPAAGVSSQAAQIAFQESDTQDSSWLPERMAQCPECLFDQIGSLNQALDCGLDARDSTNRKHAWRKCGFHLRLHRRGASKQVDEALASWDNRNSESGALDNLFACLGNDETPGF